METKVLFYTCRFHYRDYNGFLVMELEGLAAQYSLYKEIAKSKLQSSEASPSNKELQNAQVSPEESSIVSIGQSSFNQKLFKHISDHYAGRGNLSQDVNRTLGKKDRNVSQTLVSEDPRANAMYSAYRTAALSYGTEARFVSNMESSVKTASQLRKIYA